MNVSSLAVRQELRFCRVLPRWGGALLALWLAVAPALAADAPPLPWAPAPSPAAAYARSHAVAALGEKLFFDPGLSASGRISCASCHDPAHGFGVPNGLAVQPGPAQPGVVQPSGSGLRGSGARAVPSLMYGQFVPSFTEHYFEAGDEGDESVDQGPAGGRDWDGRAGQARDQAAFPLLNLDEMANSGPDAVAAAVAGSAYAGDVRRLHGEAVFADPGRVFAAVTEALEFYQETAAVFSPFSSKYDAVLRGQALLSEREASGLEIFNDKARGNCASCHKSAVVGGRPPLFTDFGYVALGLPRNPAIPANADPEYFDLGLCGPVRRDLAGQRQYCGMFKAPTLRNVALKQSFYHNGVGRSLRDAVAFYAERDTDPGKWYPVGPDGVARKFDDLPPDDVGNVSMEPPFGGRVVLQARDVDDLVAFLGTLTDGYVVR